MIKRYSVPSVMGFLQQHPILSATYAGQISDLFSLFDGKRVYAEKESYRLWQKYQSSLKCVNCNTEATFFILKPHQTMKDVYFFQLYGTNTDDKPILFTKDHIMPKSQGGKNSLENYQLMCQKCNTAKGSCLPGSRNCICRLRQAKDPTYLPFLELNSKKHFYINKHENDMSALLYRIHYLFDNHIRIHLHFKFHNVDESTIRFQLTFLDALIESKQYNSYIIKYHNLPEEFKIKYALSNRCNYFWNIFNNDFYISIRKSYERALLNKKIRLCSC